MGTAVYASGLPTELGMKMYGELEKAQHSIQLDGGLHLVYIIMLEHDPFRIMDWPFWSRQFAGLSTKDKQVCGNPVT